MCTACLCVCTYSMHSSCLSITSSMIANIRTHNPNPNNYGWQFRHACIMWWRNSCLPPIKMLLLSTCRRHSHAYHLPHCSITQLDKLLTSKLICPPANSSFVCDNRHFFDLFAQFCYSVYDNYCQSHNFLERI